MRLILTLKPDKRKNSYYLLKYDTDTKRSKGVLINNEEINKAIQSSGLIYSGNYLCVGIQYEKRNDQIFLFDIYNDKFVSFNCENSKNIGSIISIYPGKLYLDSQDTNSIVCVDFDSVNLSYLYDSIHYILNEEINFKIRSLYNYKNTWFVASHERKKIIDLTNDRSVFSDIYEPNCIFFNSNHRLCFLETGKDLFHCGDDIFKVGFNPTAAIEDRKEGGYWIACNSSLYFIDYDGEIGDIHDLSEYGSQFNNIIEAEGNFFK